MSEIPAERLVLSLGFNKSRLDNSAMPKWDIPETVVIGATPIAGGLIEKRENPNIVTSPQQAVEQFDKCIAMGAVGVHMHSVDSRGVELLQIEQARKFMHGVIDPLRSRWGRKFVPDGGVAYYGRTLEENMFPVTEGLYEVAIVNPSVGQFGDRLRVFSAKMVQDQAKWTQDQGSKVLLDIHDTSAVMNAKRWLVDTGILDRPTYWHLLTGCTDGMVYVSNVESMIDATLYMVRRIKEIDRDAVISVETAGRASMYIAALAVMLGLEIKVGLHHTIWRWPHKDEVIRNTVEEVATAVQIAKALGRDPATAEDYRARIGLKK